MVELIQKGRSLVGAVTDDLGFIEARNQAEYLSKKYGLVVADMPRLLTNLQTHSDLRNVVRPDWADVLSSEYLTKASNGDDLYVVSHGEGPFSDLDVVRKSLESYKKGFLPVNNLDSVIKNAVNIEDVRKGFVATDKPYSIAINMQKNKPVLSSASTLSKEDFLRDDGILAVTGSVQGREYLAKLLFGSKDEGGEARRQIKNLRPDNHYATSVGRPLSLCGYSLGVGGYEFFNYDGRFVLVAPDTIPRARKGLEPVLYKI